MNLRRTSGLIFFFSLVSCWQAALGQNEPPLKVEQVEKLLKTAPKAYNSHYTAGRFYEQQGSIGQAQDEYRQAIKCPGAKADAYKHLSQLLLRSTDFKEAELTARAGLKLFPNDYGMLLTTGYVLQNEAKVAAALEMYEKAQKVQPNNQQIYVALADACSALNQPAKALQYIEKALKLGKPSDLILYEQAKILVILGRFEEAKIPLATNFAENPLNFKNNKLYLSVLTSQKLPKEALLVQLCIMVPSNDRDLVLAKAAVKELLMAVSPADAKATIARAESLVKDVKLKGRLHFALGDVYDKINQPQIAIGQYQAGLSFDPSLARGYLRLGEDLESVKNDRAGALKNYQKAASLDDKDPEIQMRLKQLKEKMK